MIKLKPASNKSLAILATAILVAQLLGLLLMYLGSIEKVRAVELFIRVCGLPVAFLTIAWICLSQDSDKGRALAEATFLRSRQFIFWIVATYLLIFSYMNLSQLSFGNFDYFDGGFYLNKAERIVAARSIFDALNISFWETHFQPSMLLFGAIRWLTGSMGASVVAHTFIAGGSAFLLQKIALKNTKDQTLANLISLSFLINPLLHFNDLLLLNPDILVLPIMFGGYLFHLNGRHYMTIAVLSMVVLVSEPWIPAVAMLCFLMFFWSARKVCYLVASGALSMAFFFVWLVLLPTYSIPAEAPHMEPLNPYFFFPNSVDFEASTFFDPRKLFFIWFTFSAFVFFPTAVLAGFLVLAPELIKTLGSTEYLHYAVDGHYTLGILGILYISIARHGVDNADKTRACGVFIMHVFFLFGLGIGQGVLPYSTNFIFGTSSGAFSFERYLVSETFELDKNIIENAKVSSDKNVEATNSKVHPSLIKAGTLKVFPTDGWREADVIVLRAGSLKSAGASREQSKYRQAYLEAYRSLDCCFSLLGKTSTTEIYVSKK